MFNLKRGLWQYRFLLISMALAMSLLINRLLPLVASTQEVILTSNTPAITQTNNMSVPEEFRGKIVSEINPISDRKVIALTFDDGPTPNITPQVLDILKGYKIKATFFSIGKNLKMFPELAERLVAENHAIGNHTWHHSRRLMDRFTAIREIEDTGKLIYEITGVKTCLFRPPNGFIYNGLVDYALQRKDAIVLWSIDANDWRGAKVSVDDIVEKVVSQVQPGAIILMHDGGGDRSNTVLALPRIIDKLTQGGYEFVTVPELLRISEF